jgi:hypothetical protein
MFRILELFVELGDEYGGCPVVYEPERSKCASCTGFHRNARESERGAIVAGRSLTGAQCEQLNRLLTKCGHAHILLEIVHIEPSIEGEHVAVPDTSGKLSVRGHMHDGVGRFLKLALHVLVGERFVFK